MEVFFRWLIDRWEALYCAFIVRPYERAVHVRFGKLKRVAGPGWRFRLPFEIDEIIRINVVPTTSNLGTQVVTDLQGNAFVISVVIYWRVREDSVASMALELEDHEDVLHDTTYGMLAQVCRESDMTDLR